MKRMRVGFWFFLDFSGARYVFAKDRMIAQSVIQKSII